MLRNLFLLLVLCWSLPLSAAPRVVVSIGPVHSLVAGVMEGVGEPQLLIPAGASPHAYALKPSDARALSKAELVVWVGEGLETMLERSLHSLVSHNARVLELITVEGTHLLSTGKLGEKSERAHEGSHGGHGHGEVDTHLWLAPYNARRIVSAVAAELVELDSSNAGRYRANAAALDSRIRSLETALQVQLAPVKGRSYIVFHDAYRYFEEAFSLQSAGAITVSPERRPGARHIVEIRETIRERGAVCVFSEPQFRPDIVEVVVEGSQARHGVLDPLGAALTPGKEQWFGLMQGLADNFATCLTE